MAFCDSRLDLSPHWPSLLLLVGVSMLPGFAHGDPGPGRSPLILKAVAQNKLVIERQGKLQQYLRLGVTIDQVIQNPTLPFAAVFGSVQRRSITMDYVYIINLATGIRRRFALSREESAWYIEPRTMVWSPQGTYLQLTRFVGRGAMVPEAIIIIRTADLADWLQGKKWHSIAVKGPIKRQGSPVQPMFFGWLSNDQFAIEASLPDGEVGYSIYDIPSGQYQLQGECQANASSCAVKTRLQQRLQHTSR